MTLTIGRWPFRRTYRVTTCMSTLLRYRSAFGVSFFTDFFEGDAYACLLRLAWSSIDDNRPTYTRFVCRASKTKGFIDAAQEIQAGVLLTSGKKRNSAETAEEFDELDILAMMAVSGISMDLVNELPAFLILDVVSKRTAITSGKDNEKKYHKMSHSEMHDLYGG